MARPSPACTVRRNCGVPWTTPIASHAPTWAHPSSSARGTDLAWSGFCAGGPTAPMTGTCATLRSIPVPGAGHRAGAAAAMRFRVAGCAVGAEGVAHSPRVLRAPRMGANRERMVLAASELELERTSAGYGSGFRVVGSRLGSSFLVRSRFPGVQLFQVPWFRVPGSSQARLGRRRYQEPGIWNREPVNKEAGTNRNLEPTWNPEPGTVANVRP